MVQYDKGGNITQDELIEENTYYPFELMVRGVNDGIGALGNSVAQRWKFGGKELQDELNLQWYDITARNYDPALGRWMNIDPLAEQMRRHSPYNYAFDNPVFFIDPDGMIPFGNGEDPPIAYTGPGVAVGDNVVNQLEEVVIVVNGNEGTVATGTAQGSHIETTETGKRFYGFKAEGQLKGKYGKLRGSVSGFSAGYEGYTEDGGAHGMASIYGVSADTEARLGTEDNNVAVEAEGSAFSAEVSGDAGLYTGGEGKYGAELGANAGAYALKGEVTPSISIFGVQIGITVGGSLGSAHIGARGAATFDSNSNEFEVTGKAHIGLGAGLKIGFEITNTKQRIYGSRKKRK